MNGDILSTHILKQDRIGSDKMAATEKIPSIQSSPVSALKPLEIGAAYIRVSTDDQTELSPDAQLREIIKRAKEDGITIPQEFIFMEDRGRSGRRADNRPQFQKMISIAKQQPSPFSRLYVWKFSRFARNQEESIFYKGILTSKCGVNICSVSEPIMEGMFGKLIERIIEWFDEFYSVNLSGEVIRGMTEKALRNGYQATPCLGYDAAGGGAPFVINEKEYEIVEFIHQSYHSGMDLAAIAREINRRGWRTKRKNPFDRRTVQGILTNKFYTGLVTWKEISFYGPHEIRESVTSIFEDNQKRLEAEFRPKMRREVSSCRHWASGLLKCGYCGASLGYNKAGGGGRSPSFFQCWKYAKSYHDGSCSITVKKVEESILQSLRQTVISGNVNYEYVRNKSEIQTGEEASLANALVRLNNKEIRIRDAYENGIDTLEEYKQNRLRLKAEREDLETRLKELTEARNTADQKQNAPQNKEKMLAQLQIAYDTLADLNISYEEKGNALRRVCKQIVYDKENNALRFYYYMAEPADESTPHKPL